jgi:hypothetical protein
MTHIATVPNQFQRWNAFMTDLGWITARAASDKDAPIL